jgi:hypothetical protein
MRQYFILITYLISFSVLSLQGNNETPDGQIFKNVDDTMIAWDADKQKWMTIENFWTSFSMRSGGKAWGEGREFPNYSDVNEADTFVYVTNKGKCLMEFFHERWRRAQDVERWDVRFNEYDGCPYVFDE